MTTAERYAPDYRLEIAGRAAPSSLRARISSLRVASGLEGSDRLDIEVVNEGLRFLDHPDLALDTPIRLSIGYTTGLTDVFTGRIVAVGASFPAAGPPTLTVTAQDAMHELQQGKHTLWYGIPTPKGTYPIPDPAILAAGAARHHLIPIAEPVSATIAVVLGGVTTFLGKDDQHVLRRQVGESDFDFLARVARENGWDMTIDHSGPLGGQVLRFLSAASDVVPAVVLRYGASLGNFSPRISDVGQVAGIRARIWRADLKLAFLVSVGWNWDRQSLEVSLGADAPGTQASRSSSRTTSGATFELLDEAPSVWTAPRIILGRLLPKLNQRLTTSGSCPGDPRITPGSVVQIDGVGQQFGGLYRITAANHDIDQTGYRTRFKARKEIWFGSIPTPKQQPFVDRLSA